MSNLFGGGNDPVANVAPVIEEQEEGKKSVKKLRTALYKTEGGAAGEEVLEGGTKTRTNIFGN